MTPLDAETRAHLAYVVLTAQRWLPQLAVAITPHCADRWATDRCCSRIWIGDHQTGPEILQALGEALADLRANQRTRLHIPEQRRGEPAGVP